jgi:hypothetical protein
MIMQIPDIVFSEEDLAQLEAINSVPEDSSPSKKPAPQAETLDLGNEELSVEGLDS